MSSQALASLTETYTDSEDEENAAADDEIEDKSDNEDRLTPLPMVISAPNSKTNSPISKAVKTLVSYHDDTIVSDDEPVEDNEIIEENNTQDSRELVNDEEIDESLLPPPVKKKCSNSLQEKISRLYDKMKNGSDMNELIQKRKDFRNPSIYEKLIQFCGINELGTNYPPEIYDPLKWGEDSYYEELAKLQKLDMERREKERKEKTKIEVVSGTAKKLSEEELKRKKSKWDQPAPNISSSQQIKPAGLVQPTLTTTSASGTKTTVISAFGSLQKKQRI